MRDRDVRRRRWRGLCLQGTKTVNNAVARGDLDRRCQKAQIANQLRERESRFIVGIRLDVSLSYIFFYLTILSSLVQGNVA